MPQRLDVLKTYKLYIDGKFPRSESGRTLGAGEGAGVIAHVARASRKDLRDAVEAARRAQAGWASLTAYNRGQVLYRMAEMMEGKAEEFAQAIDGVGGGDGESKKRRDGAKGGARAKRTSANPTPALPPGGRGEVMAAIDRLVCFAGWADKYSQVLGCNNPVAGPYYNFTVPEATGVVCVVAPDECPLLALISLMAPPLCAGNAVVAVASQANPIPAAILGEVCATSDVPAGVVNLLTGERAELLPHISTHRDIDAIHAAASSADEARILREGVAENLKRVVLREGREQGAKGSRGAGVDWYDAEACHSPWWIEPFVEMKTVWHPAAT